ncbi:MAG: hypothetical protein D8B54_06465 [Catonella sp.]|nr:MAG: hypothetical protein D8B54_06465 [Catonella sp.]
MALYIGGATWLYNLYIVFFFWVKKRTEKWLESVDLVGLVMVYYIMFLGTHEPFSKNRQKHSKKL